MEQFISGEYVQRFQYESFEPTLINHGWSWDSPRINVLLEEANARLGELNAFSKIVPDVDFFIRMHVVKEAQTSSKIEGTQTSMHEVLLPAQEVAPERRDDWDEVQNYIQAVGYAIDQLEHLPMSGRLIRETHEVLLQGLRGEHKQPGQFRVSQNWIGGSSLADAVFIPPYHESIPGLMADLEAFWHNDHIAVPALIRAALSHYQFETIHPFLDGNGRIGRLLIVLYLVSTGTLSRPALYLSDFLERHRAQYYDALMRVRVSNDLVHWVQFFLSGVAQTATNGVRVFERVLTLREEVERLILDFGQRAPTAKAAIEHMYSYPIRTAAELSEALDISAPTSNRLLQDLVKRGILVETTGLQRNRRYEFEPYINLFID